MSIDNELSRRLNEWFSSRRQVLDWVARQDASGPTAETDQFFDLRSRCYDCEWNLLSLGARKEAWERLLENESDLDREEALELRSGVGDLEIVSDRQKAHADGMTVSAWWFIPYAVWVGLPRRALWTGPVDHAEPMLTRVIRLFNDAAKERIPEKIKNEMETFGGPLRAVFQFTPGMDADKLRDFLMPPGAMEDWPDQDRNILSFSPDPESPLRAGCVGIYLAADTYRTLALVRDMVRDMVMEVAKDNHDPHLQIGPLMPRRGALAESEILRWELWAEQALAAPLAPGALTRHVSFTVERENGSPVRLVADSADMDDTQVHEVDAFACRLGDDDMIHHALQPFMACPRPDVSWSVHQQELKTEGDEAPEG